MIDLLRHILAITIGFASGVVVSGAVFAFISVIGVVPRFAQKTNTRAHVKIYETALTLGGIFGTLTGLIDFRIPLGPLFAATLSLSVGIFYGSLAMSLAEVLDVIPILARRLRVARGIFFFILAIALGKMLGSLFYFLSTGFYDANAM